MTGCPAGSLMTGVTEQLPFPPCKTSVAGCLAMQIMRKMLVNNPSRCGLNSLDIFVCTQLVPSSCHAQSKSVTLHTIPGCGRLVDNYNCKIASFQIIPAPRALVALHVNSHSPPPPVQLAMYHNPSLRCDERRAGMKYDDFESVLHL